MKKLFSSSLLLLAVSTVWGAVQEAIPVMNAAGVMKALPIYSNELIDKAPEGEAVTGIRDCYTSYFLGGVNYRDFENGGVGEYIIGEDGNIYLRDACYSAAKISPLTDTYLKLEKVDET